MLILGHPFIQYSPFFFIDSHDEIAKTPANSTLMFNYTDDAITLAKHCEAQGIAFAMSVETLTQLNFAENLGASFLIVDKSLCQAAQKVAESYLYDAKILCRVFEESELESLLLDGIDGVMFPDAVVIIANT